MKPHGRKSIRLKGFDYSEPGEYFVTICTKSRECTFGEIKDGAMVLSQTGAVVEKCWKEIPAHFENTRVDVYRIMPNHVHGIIVIKEQTKRDDPPRHSRRDVACNVPTGSSAYYSAISPKPKSLSTIIRSFKSAVTKHGRNKRISGQKPLWQTRFYDHIIRSDVDYFFIQRYIELNPFLWHLDSDNPEAHKIPIDQLKRTLKETHGLDDSAIAYLIDCEMNYRTWQEMEMTKDAEEIEV